MKMIQWDKLFIGERIGELEVEKKMKKETGKIGRILGFDTPHSLAPRKLSMLV